MPRRSAFSRTRSITPTVTYMYGMPTPYYTIWLVSTGTKEIFARLRRSLDRRLADDAIGGEIQTIEPKPLQ